MKIKSILITLFITAMGVLGVSAPASAAFNWPSDCTQTVDITGGKGCFQANGDDFWAWDTYSDGYHVEVHWWSDTGLTNECHASGAGAINECSYDFSAGTNVKFQVKIYNGTSLIRQSAWTGWISVGQ
ncbi:MAG: hypothetical protein ACRDT8_09295 [Micromonosporaceae bacterium]